MIHTGDCIEVMRTLPEACVDAVVTDPPYGLEFMGKGWDKFKVREGNPFDAKQVIVKDSSAEPRAKDNPWQKEASGYGGPKKMPKCRNCGKWQYNGHKPSQCHCEQPDWDYRMSEQMRPFQAWCEAWGREALRVTKPGGYLLAFGGTRTHHRLVCGLEDAGWIIRDELDWIYASGFPKGKANLKPAHEPIVLARKPGPLRPLAIDACRIGTTREVPASHSKTAPTIGATGFQDRRIPSELDPNMGRWPSNLLLSDPELFDEPNPYVVGSGAVQDSPTTYTRSVDGKAWGAGGVERFTNNRAGDEQPGFGDTGGYSRFFIIPKAARADREPVLRGQLPRTENADWPQEMDPGASRGAAARENSHPTVKPVDVMRHLVRLVTPTGGTVLDCFLGSGSTALACEMEGFPWIGIEKEPEYVAIAEARLNGIQKGLGLAV